MHLSCSMLVPLHFLRSDWLCVCASRAGVSVALFCLSPPTRRTYIRPGFQSPSASIMLQDLLLALVPFVNPASFFFSRGLPVRIARPGNNNNNARKCVLGQTAQAHEAREGEGGRYAYTHRLCSRCCLGRCCCCLPHLPPSSSSTEWNVGFASRAAATNHISATFGTLSAQRARERPDIARLSIERERDWPNAR